MGWIKLNKADRGWRGRKVGDGDGRGREGGETGKENKKEASYGGGGKDTGCNGYWIGARLHGTCLDFPLVRVFC